MGIKGNFIWIQNLNKNPHQKYIHEMGSWCLFDIFDWSMKWCGNLVQQIVCVCVCVFVLKGSIVICLGFGNIAAQYTHLTFNIWPVETDLSHKSRLHSQKLLISYNTNSTVFIFHFSLFSSPIWYSCSQLRFVIWNVTFYNHQTVFTLYHQSLLHQHICYVKARTFINTMITGDCSRDFAHKFCTFIS